MSGCIDKKSLAVDEASYIEIQGRGIKEQGIPSLNVALFKNHPLKCISTEAGIVPTPRLQIDRGGHTIFSLDTNGNRDNLFSESNRMTLRKHFLNKVPHEISFKWGRSFNSCEENILKMNSGEDATSYIFRLLICIN
jgi:hypothetical protein